MINDFDELKSLILKEVVKSKTRIKISQSEITLSLFSDSIFTHELKEALTLLLDEYGAEYSWTEKQLTIGEI